MSTIKNEAPHESIAILGWGSLILNPPDSNLTDDDRLRVPGCWHSDGPCLPLEFSHVNDDSRLLLVVDPTHGRNCQVFYTLSGFTSAADAINSLQAKENLRVREHIHMQWKGRSASESVSQGVAKWMEDHHFDAAIWVGLGNNFKEKTGQQFTPDNALTYLETLPGDRRAAACAYIGKVPDSMDTPVRQKVRMQMLPPVPA